MIFIFRCDFLFRPYPAVLKHTDVFPFQNSVMSWSKQRAPPSSFIRVSLISGQAKKRSERCLWTNRSISLEIAEPSELHRAEQTIDWLCFPQANICDANSTAGSERLMPTSGCCSWKSVCCWSLLLPTATASCVYRSRIIMRTGLLSVQ